MVVLACLIVVLMACLMFFGADKTEYALNCVTDWAIEYFDCVSSCTWAMLLILFGMLILTCNIPYMIHKAYRYMSRY